MDLSAFVEFVPMRPLGTLAQTLRLFGETGRGNVAVCIDPLNFARSGARPADISSIDPKLLPYGQLSDGLVHADEPAPSASMRPNVRRLMGEGSVPVAEIVAAMPAGLAYSLELPLELSAALPGADGRMMSAAAWAKFVLAHAKEFLGRQAKSNDRVPARFETGAADAPPRCSSLAFLPCSQLRLSNARLRSRPTPIPIARSSSWSGLPPAGRPICWRGSSGNG